MYLCLALQAQGLWNLFCTLELPLIKILAGMKVSVQSMNLHYFHTAADYAQVECNS